jgi:hypothetical protein
VSLCGAALCAAPPLLAAELSGADPSAAALRTAARAAVTALTASGPGLIAVVAVGDALREWPPDGQPDLAPYGGPPLRSGSPVPLGVGLGARLLDDAGWAGGRSLWSIGCGDPLARCRELASAVCAASSRVGLLVLADGSARRTLKAPGYLDERAGPYDASIEAAIVDGDLTALHRLDPALAGELMVTGWPAFQVLAAAFAGNRAETTMLYAGAPFGVGYLVATLRPATDPGGG